MHRIFKDVKGVSYFQDDSLMHAKDQEEHDKLFHTVLARLKENGLTVQRDKCKFNQTAVDYLGHTVTPDWIKPKRALLQLWSTLRRHKTRNNYVHFLVMRIYV